MKYASEKRYNVVLLKTKDLFLNSMLVPSPHYSSLRQHWDTISTTVCGKLILKPQQYVTEKISSLNFPPDR